MAVTGLTERVSLHRCARSPGLLGSIAQLELEVHRVSRARGLPGRGLLTLRAWLTPKDADLRKQQKLETDMLSFLVAASN